MRKILSFKLSRLRDIGWTKWDPIGLLGSREVWQDHPEFADEYDNYLRELASGLASGWSLTVAKDYLLAISSEHMGLGTPDENAILSAEATVRSIKDYVDECANE